MSYTQGRHYGVLHRGQTRWKPTPNFPHGRSAKIQRFCDIIHKCQQEDVSPEFRFLMTSVQEKIFRSTPSPVTTPNTTTWTELRQIKNGNGIEIP